MKEITCEIIGSILIIREQIDQLKIKEFAKTVLKKKSNIKTVVLQTSKTKGFERVRELKHIAGIKTFETIYKEYGNAYTVDISTTFFSPRLSYERQRIAKMVKEREVILNFFSGVGPFSISIAKNCEECIIHSIELNKNAYKHLLSNIVINKCVNKVKAYLGDAFSIVPMLFYNKVDRVLLPLPLEAEKSLPIAYRALRDGKGIIHWQITERRNNHETNNHDIKNRIIEILNENEIKTNFQIEEVRIIRWLAPRVAHKAIDISFK